MKVVINRCYGGFSISQECAELMEKLGSESAKVMLDEFKESGAWYGYGIDEGDRAYPVLVQAVEQLGSERASGQCAELAIVEIPDDVEWEIEEYDGKEWIAEKHRTWHA